MTLTGKNSQIGFSRLNRSSRLSLLQVGRTTVVFEIARQESDAPCVVFGQDALTTMLDVQRGQLTDSAKPTL